MPSNQILPFCTTDTGSNLLTQAQYQADAQRTIGNQPGVARSKLVNKALKQATAIASGVAQFLAMYQEERGITDDMTAQVMASCMFDAVTNATISDAKIVSGRPVCFTIKHLGIKFIYGTAYIGTSNRITWDLPYAGVTETWCALASVSNLSENYTKFSTQIACNGSTATVYSVPIAGEFEAHNVSYLIIGKPPAA